MSDQDQHIEVAIERIRTALEQQRLTDALTILQSFHPADQAEIFNYLEEDERDDLISRLNVAQTADLLEEVTDEAALDAAESMPTAFLADVLDEMEPDEAADLIGDLAAGQAQQVLAEMEDASEVIPLLGYPDETAGGRMTTAYITLHPDLTAEESIEFLRQSHPDIEVPYYLFVVSDDNRLVGVVGLRELVTVSPHTLVGKILNRDVISVEVNADQERVVEVMSRYDLAALPVVDDQHRLLGVVARDDMMDALEQEATEDILHLGAIETGPLSDRSYWTQKISNLVRSRFLWLLILFVAETLTGTVIRLFEDEVLAMVSLSFFIPLLIGTGGNAGSQTVSTVIRALALREIRHRDALRVLSREVAVGIFLGILLGIVAVGWSRLWGVEWNLSFTVGISILAICVWSTTVASLIPVIASRFGVDPTIVSGPLMATLIDATGLVIYFSLAAWIMPQL